MFLGRIHRDHSAPSELLTVISRLDGGPASSGAPPSSRCLRKAIKILAMRNPALGLGISLDGYIARPDGTFDFLFMPKDYSMAPFFATVDTALMGRKTFDAALKMGGAGFQQIAYGYLGVLSLPAGGKPDGVIFTRQSPGAVVRKIRKKKGKNIWLKGGGELARDELYIGMVPVLSGEGIPLFPAGFPQREFSLVENKTYSKGLIALKYKRKR
jgi:dihydrofolate reductase